MAALTSQHWQQGESWTLRMKLAKKREVRITKMCLRLPNWKRTPGWRRSITERSKICNAKWWSGTTVEGWRMETNIQWWQLVRKAEDKQHSKVNLLRFSQSGPHICYPTSPSRSVHLLPSSSLQNFSAVRSDGTLRLYVSFEGTKLVLMNFVPCTMMGCCWRHRPFCVAPQGLNILRQESRPD
jgi:hypothetical protein